MKFRIYFTVDDYEDSYDIVGDTVEEIIDKNKTEMKRRNLDADKNNCWSLEIKNTRS